MKIINFKADREENILIKRDQAVIQLTKTEIKIFEFIIKNTPAGNKPLPEIEMELQEFCLNCGCTMMQACEGGCSFVQPFKCDKCYNEEGYRIK